VWAADAAVLIAAECVGVQAVEAVAVAVLIG
jgi:hypothetical protein